MHSLKSRLISAALCAGFLLTPITANAAVLRFGADEPRYDLIESITGTAKSSATTTQSFVGSEKYPYSKVLKTIKKYKKENDDVKGWLVIPNTNINEPILYSNKNNDYYLYRDWKGKKYNGITYKNFVNTATYLDYRSVLGETWKKSSRNLVLYGHNWTNLRSPIDIGNVSKHTMFAQLPSYVSQKFAQDNPYIYFSTENNEGIWKVFSVAYVEVSSDFHYNNPKPNVKKGEYAKLLKELKDRSIHDFDVEVDETDRIITLSTCTRQYDVGESQRFIVVARLLREGESEKDKVTVTPNEDMKKPNMK